VEFFGVARSRVDAAKITLAADRLRDLLVHFQNELPSLAELCIENGELAPGWLLNINGAAFTRDLNTSLNDGDSVLLIPADAGG
jgi:molybdopterin converting factor small subunit